MIWGKGVEVVAKRCGGAPKRCKKRVCGKVCGKVWAGDKNVQWWPKGAGM
jgi:hypothetical protein